MKIQKIYRILRYSLDTFEGIYNSKNKIKEKLLYKRD